MSQLYSGITQSFLLRLGSDPIMH